MGDGFHRHTQSKSISNFMSNGSSNSLRISSCHFHSKFHLIQLAVSIHVHCEFPNFWKLPNNCLNCTWEYIDPTDDYHTINSADNSTL